VSLGPDTETGALKDPVSGGAFQAAEPARSEPGSSTQVDWRELQGRFVDDPRATVREAGALVEKVLGEVRSRSESGSTEELRTAFRHFRDLYINLSTSQGTPET
jgi:hypothetical protein